MQTAQLHKLLDDIYLYMKELEPVLDKEQYILSQGRIDGSLLQGITQQKEMFLASIISLNKRRVLLQETEGFMEPFTDLNNYAITSLWTHITQLGQKIAQQNLNNGYLLQYHLNFATEAIKVLSAEAGTQVYGPNGQTTSKFPGGKKLSI